jgi:hypothetical protein
MKSILIAASLLWIATWISAQEVTGLPDETTTSSSDVPEITSTVPEEPSSTTTTEEPTTTTESSHNEYCFNGGNVSCSCPPGFTGKRCESREQFTFLYMNLVFNNDRFSCGLVQHNHCA